MRSQSQGRSHLNGGRMVIPGRCSMEKVRLKESLGAVKILGRDSRQREHPEKRHGCRSMGEILGEW